MGVTETAVVQAERILAERLQPFLEAAENANGSLAGLWQSEYETRSNPCPHKKDPNWVALDAQLAQWKVE